MDVYYYFNYRMFQTSHVYRKTLISVQLDADDTKKTTVSAGWMMLESIPLIASPTVIITMLSPDVRETTRTLFCPALLAAATLADRMSR